MAINVNSQPSAILAEDEPLLRAQFVKRLKEHGLNCNCAKASMAPKLCRRSGTSARRGFLDVQMPGMTGLEVASGEGSLSLGIRYRL